MSKLKDKIYSSLVKKNGRVWYEYERYVREHMVEHKTHRLRHIIILLKLNWFYRVKKGNTPYLYWDTPLDPEDTVHEEIVVSEYDGTPLELKIDKITDSTVSLKWNSVPGVYEYIIYKCEKNDVYRKDGITCTTAFNVRKLKGFTDYKFKVIATLFSHSEIESNEIELTTLYPINSKEKNPYLEGAESDYKSRRSVHFLAKELLLYDVISFDVFDTLLFRPFNNSRDLFMLLDHEFQIMGFAKIRQDCEMKVREKAQLIHGNREVTISDIYEEIERITGINRDKGIDVEFKLEECLCYANEYMLRLFELLKYAGKRIIIVSDMYFSAEMIEKLLNKCGFYGFEKVFVSCERHSNKYTGTIYKNILNELKIDANQICHIGDNYEADYKKAKQAGWQAFYYESCNAIGNPYRASEYGMTPLIGSAYAGICNNFLHQGLEKYSTFYEYGFLYGGLYVYGFCNWLYRLAKERQCSKIIFLARDGYIYKRVFDDLFKDIGSIYAFWSRNANSIATAERDKFLFIQRNIRVKASYELSVTIESLLKQFGLEELEGTLQQSKLHKSDNLTQTNVSVIEEWFIAHWNEIIKIFNKNSEAYREYYSQIIGEDSNVILVDTGWQGTTLLGLKWLLEQKWKMVNNAYCCMAASETANPIVNQTQLLTNDLLIYMFSINKNRDLYLYHKNRYKGHLCSFLFELFTQAPHPTLNGIGYINEKLQFQFGIPEVENYTVIKEIQKGIEDFARLYESRFKEFDFMKNISGRDAYIPFEFISKNPRLYLLSFLQLKYSKSTGGDFTNQKVETLEEIIRASL